ncbi:MAG: TolC family protein [Bacteroidaceae bacterium]
MRLIYIILLFLFPFFLSAQEIYTLEQCRDMALEHNRQKTIADKQIEKSKSDVRVYRSNFFPKLSAQGNYLYSSQKMKQSIGDAYLPTFIPDGQGGFTPNLGAGSTPTNPVFGMYAYLPEIPLEFTLKNTWMAGFQLTQPLYMGGKIRASYAMSKIGKDMAYLNQELSRVEVILLADEAYWALVKTQELCTAAEKYVDVVTELYRNVKNAYEVGLKSKNDLLKVQVKVNEAKLQLRRAENGIILARMNLAHTIGLPLTEDIRTSNEIPTTETNYVEDLFDVTPRPEYQLLSKQVELKSKDIQLARSQFLPNLGVSAGWNYYDGAKLNGDKLLHGGSFSAIVSLNIPLFQWGEGANKVRSKKTERQIAELQRLDAVEKMTLEVTQAHNQLDESKLEVEMTTNSLDQAEENLKISKEHFEVGLENLADYLEAQTLWQKAWSEFISAKASLKLNETKYLKASGQL